MSPAIKPSPRFASFEIDSADSSVQTLTPPNNLQRFEGVAFSTSGDVLGVATADTNTIYLFRKAPDGLFEKTPYGSISGAKSGLNYPHDLSFARSGDTELLAVAQRVGSIAVYANNRVDDHYGTEPVFEICGAEARLDAPDGVAFVPPKNAYLAACNFQTSCISFYRKTTNSSIEFQRQPDFVLNHEAVCGPDGLAFTRCGKWLAIANHRNNTVSIFQRGNWILSGGKLKYGPTPVTVIEDLELRYPHSVAFTPKTNHLVVTNAGANYLSVYQPQRRGLRMQWSQSPVVQHRVAPDEIFRHGENATNKMEGGPKGVAIHNNMLAVCSPEFGIRIYSFRETF